MNLASLRMVPSILVLLTRSDPARSTRFSFDLLTVSSPACVQITDDNAGEITYCHLHACMCMAWMGVGTLGPLTVCAPAKESNGGSGALSSQDPW